MTLPVALLLVLGLSAVPGTIAQTSYLYSPQITMQLIPGKITATTFALEMPTCVFTTNQADEIWLLVSFENATSSLQASIPTGDLPYYDLKNKGYYRTLKTYGSSLPCGVAEEQTRVIRVGGSTSCVGDMSILDCNGPLPTPASYRVMFYAMNGNVVTARTRWSEVISLKTGKERAGIDTWPGRRSGGMIVITTILSVLLAILLACFIAALAFGSNNICWRKQLKSTETVEGDFNRHQRYTTHHTPAQEEQRI